MFPISLILIVRLVMYLYEFMIEINFEHKSIGNNAKINNIVSFFVIACTINNLISFYFSHFLLLSYTYSPPFPNLISITSFHFSF